MGIMHFGKQSRRANMPNLADVRDVIISPRGLAGILRMPSHARALIIFAHGSGSNRLSPRSRAVAQALSGHGMATLLFDLVTEAEAEDPTATIDIAALADRLADAVAWADAHEQLRLLPAGLFGADTGAAAAVVAAARLGPRIGAVVSRGGRADLAGDAFSQIDVPLLMIAGGEDREVIALDEQALARSKAPKAIEIVPGAGHLFREPGALTAVTVHAARWFEEHLIKSEAVAQQAQPRASSG